MKYFGKFVFVFFVLLLAGCGQETEPTPEARQTSAPPPLNITYCDINPSDLCLEGFDLNDEGQTLIYFLADDYSFADIYVQAEVDDEEFTFVCGQSQTTPENVYCLGDALPDGETSVTLNVYAKASQEQIARGAFVLQYLSLPAPDVDFDIIIADATQTVTPVVEQPETQTAVPTVIQPATHTTVPTTVQDATESPITTRTPLPDYPNPTLDSYPNPTLDSYPNSTSSP